MGRGRPFGWSVPGPVIRSSSRCEGDRSSSELTSFSTTRSRIRAARPCAAGGRASQRRQARWSDEPVAGLDHERARGARASREMRRSIEGRRPSLVRARRRGGGRSSQSRDRLRDRPRASVAHDGRGVRGDPADAPRSVVERDVHHWHRSRGRAVVAGFLEEARDGDGHDLRADGHAAHQRDHARPGARRSRSPETPDGRRSVGSTTGAARARLDARAASPQPFVARVTRTRPSSSSERWCDCARSSDGTTIDPCSVRGSSSLERRTKRETRRSPSGRAARSRCFSPSSKSSIRRTRVRSKARDRAARSPYDWVLFTSANGVDRFFAALERPGRDARAFGGAKIGVIGPGTAAALSSAAASARTSLRRSSWAKGSLARSSAPARCGSVLIPRALVARDALPDALRAAGATVDVVPVYQTIAASLKERAELVAALRNERAIDVALFTSSSTVTEVVDLLGARRGADSIGR